MSKQIKIFLVIGILLIVAVGVYLMWPEGEVATERGVSLDNAAATE
jgi:hypothetical protein